MANYNKVILVGNLTRDPQMSYLPSQTPVVEFGLAVNRRWRGADNQQREDVCFIDCRAFGKQAETINQYLKKGRQLLVEGRLQLDSWEGKDGVKRSKHRVVVENFQFIGPAGPGGPGARAPAAEREPAEPAHEEPAEPPAPEGGQDDIPF
jgi:single-strand DNA-binding protein